MTRELLGQVEPCRVGVVQVEQVLAEHLSQVRVLEGGERIAANYTVRAEFDLETTPTD